MLYVTVIEGSNSYLEYTRLYLLSREKADDDLPISGIPINSNCCHLVPPCQL